MDDAELVLLQGVPTLGNCMSILIWRSDLHVGNRSK